MPSKPYVPSRNRVTGFETYSTSTFSNQICQNSSSKPERVLLIPKPYSSQQLKGVAVTSDLKVIYEAVFDFDADAAGFDIKKGVLTSEAEGEVYAPVAMWLQAIDTLLQRLLDKGMSFLNVEAISGAGTQHGTSHRCHISFW